MPNNDHAEIARQLVHEWIEYDLDESLHSDYVAALEPESLQERIEHALNSAADDREREVRAKVIEVVNEKLVGNRGMFQVAADLIDGFEVAAGM